MEIIEKGETYLSQVSKVVIISHFIKRYPDCTFRFEPNYERQSLMWAVIKGESVKRLDEMSAREAGSFSDNGITYLAWQLYHRKKAKGLGWDKPRFPEGEKNE